MKWVIAGVVIFGLVIWAGLGMPGWSPTGMIYEGKRVVYPLYSSVCCEAKQFGDWDPAPITDIRAYEQSYTCPDSTTQCRVKEPQVTCPGISWVHLLGTTPVWGVKVLNPGDYRPAEYCSFPFCNSLSSPREFQPSGTVYYQGACIDNSLFINPGAWYQIINLLSGATITPTYGHISVEFVHTELWRYPAMEGQYSIPNTILCTKNAVVDQLIRNNPINKLKAQMAKVLVEGEEGIDLDPDVAYEGELSESIFPMKPGQCYLTVDKWVDLPFWGNVNPVGQYKGQDVICSPSKGLIKIEPLETSGGADYYVPTQRLAQPNMFCCSHGDCLAYGVGYNCIDYSCQVGAGYCSSDLDCQPQGGEMLDANCYRDYNTGQFFQWSASCNFATNVCREPNREEVKCCPSYCSQWGKWCDPEGGCQDPVIPKPDCPPRYCCDGTNHKSQDCVEGLECCATGDPHMGICKERCENCAEEGQNCDLIACCPDLECTGGIFGIIGKTCQQPILNWLWLIIPILAILFGLIGYFAWGWLGAIILGIVGAVIGYGIYWFFSLPVIVQWLIGIGGVVGGGVLIYLFGGAIAGFIMMIVIVAVKK